MSIFSSTLLITNFNIYVYGKCILIVKNSGWSFTIAATQVAERGIIQINRIISKNPLLSSGFLLMREIM